MENNGLNKLTQVARREAYSLNHDYIGPEHLLLAMMKTDSLANKALVNSGANYELFRTIVINNKGKGNAVTATNELSEDVRKIYERAKMIASSNGRSFAQESDVLFVLLDEEDSFTNIMFLLSGIDQETVRRNLKDLIQQASSGKKEEGLGETVDQFARNLNEEAKAGKIDPVIGRDKEIERTIQILLRRTKNNPILIGEPGVGKTAIIEGLAQGIVEGKVPDIIKDKIIVSLDLASMLAGTKYRGDFEERLKNLLEDLSKRDDTILFIDEFHMVLGAGAAEGSMDAANILKPVLARGEIQIIGATTTDEYRKHVEKDSALARRMQPVTVEEPNPEDTKKILKGLRGKYEDHHGVKIPDETIEAAVDLSDRYINDRYLPDKALDLIDEACSRVRMENYTDPKKDLDPLKKIEDLQREKEEAVEAQDFEKAAEIRDLINQETYKLEEEKTAEKTQKELPSLTRDDVAKVVSSRSKVPVTRLTEDEREKYADLDKKLKEEVIGQDAAIDKISHAIKRARVGLKDPNKPIGSFIFVGPTGVGKTYLAKSLAKNLFGDEENLVRLDMSEYMEKFSVSRLVGSPPGYVGYDEGGQLTDQVRSHPYSVVLFDEIEKAHPDVFNLLLQILDDGRLTDGQGRTVDFKNTLIIMTSNVGVSSLNQTKTIGFSTGNEEKLTEDKNKEIIQGAIKNTFRPEFLNRLDDTIMFNSLTKENIKEIAGLMLAKTQERLEKLDIGISYDDQVIDYLVEGGFNREFGARPLQRYITKEIEDRLAEEILDGSLVKDNKIVIKRSEEGLAFENEGKTEESEVTDPKVPDQVIN